MRDTGDAPLSIVIPTYNESSRIDATLTRIDSWRQDQARDVEVIVVDDGSRDATTEIVETHPWVKLIRNPHRGKACAVRTGMLAASGDHVLFSDADLAVPLHEFERMLTLQRQGFPVVIASREGKQANRIGEPWYRHAMGRVFNWLVQVLALPGIRDTQCGFKLFERPVAREIFSNLKLYDDSAPVLQGAAVTAFDVEVLFLARKLGHAIGEIPVEWHYGDESKVGAVSDSWRNFRDVLRVRWNDLCGRYARELADKN